ncbi:uncharacterized protein LOC131853894 [Achroia grisella]|uniref:uncharacterized protein LOC131853894 n=1 Tax=Achroia grisella TaxID=688607 RepID=UPI0027D34BEB|nr:uncharacterized protein LOC131853894 [Achroia grisella]
MMEMGADEDPPDGGGTTANLSDQMSLDTSLVSRKRQATNDLNADESKKVNSPSDSIQSVYTKPGFENDNSFKYKITDSAPYSVHITRVEPDTAAGFSIRLLKFAQFIHKNNIVGIKEGGIKALGRNKISVEFKTYSDANNFVDNPILSNNKYSAMIPKFQISRMGVIRNIPTDWSLEELVFNLISPDYAGQIIRARRLNTKSRKPDNTVSWIPSTTVVITFEGQVLPEKVYCFNTSLPVFPYNLPTIQCRNCCRFGHIRTQCRSQPRCYQCGSQHSGDNCDQKDESPFCILCDSTNHQATNSTCPEHVRQKNIKIIMVEENISHMEASARFPTPKRSYADMASAPAYNLSQSTITQTYQQSLHSSPSKTPQKNVSYRKTIYNSPRPRPNPGKSYDREAHYNIIQTPRSTQANGSALRHHQERNIDTTPLATPNDNLIELLTCSLINIISKFSDALPSNVVFLIQQLLSTLASNNGPAGPTVEY